MFVLYMFQTIVDRTVVFENLPVLYVLSLEKVPNNVIWNIYP